MGGYVVKDLLKLLREVNCLSPLRRAIIEGTLLIIRMKLLREVKGLNPLAWACAITMAEWLYLNSWLHPDEATFE